MIERVPAAPALAPEEPRPLVSVVIPSRDRPALVSLAVESARRQTYGPVEIVVVDDASEPALELTLDQRADDRVRVVRLPKRLGSGAARNIGARNSHGPLIAFLDDDDEWRPEKLEREVAVLEAAADDVAAVESGFDLRDGPRHVFRYLPKVDRDLARTLVEQPCMQPSTVLIRRAVFEALGGFDPTPGLMRTEDWDLWVRLADRYRVAVVPEALVRRRLNRQPPWAECLEGHRTIVKRLDHRVGALPPAERARVRAAHALGEGTILVGMGQAGRARQLFWRAWRHNPRAVRPLLHLARTLTGERVWENGKLAFAALRRPLARAAGRDPLVREW